MNRRPGWQVVLERRREKGETTVERKNKEVGQTALRQEKSCGALCFLTENGVRQVLMVKHRAGGHWAFPKGHVEGAETEHQTAIREVMEETGVPIEILPGYRETTSYSPCRGVMKEVVYFWAKALSSQTCPQPEEVQIARFVPVGEAMKLLTYDADRILLEKAEKIQKGIDK